MEELVLRLARDGKLAALALSVAGAISCAHPSPVPAPFRCPARSVDAAGWREVQVTEAPVALRLPISVRRYFPLQSPFYPTGWTMPDSARADSGGQGIVLLVDVRADTAHVRDLRDFIANWFPRTPQRECDVFVVRVDGRPLRVTLFQSRDSGGANEDQAAPYNVDAIMPLVENSTHPSWIVFAGKSTTEWGQRALVTALRSLRIDTALAAASHPIQACLTPPDTTNEATWVRHRLRVAPFVVEQPAQMTWGEEFMGIDNWTRPMTDSDRVPPNAFQIDLIRSPTWQLPSVPLPPPYRITCRSTVAGYPANVTVDTMGAVHVNPADPESYKGYAFVKVGLDSVLRIRASVFDDTVPPAGFLRVLSHIARADSQ